MLALAADERTSSKFPLLSDAPTFVCKITSNQRRVNSNNLRRDALQLLLTRSSEAAPQDLLCVKTQLQAFRLTGILNFLNFSGYVEPSKRRSRSMRYISKEEKLFSGLQLDPCGCKQQTRSQGHIPAISLPQPQFPKRIPAALLHSLTGRTRWYPALTLIVDTVLSTFSSKDLKLGEFLWSRTHIRNA